jgi:hypothetical protein
MHVCPASASLSTLKYFIAVISVSVSSGRHRARVQAGCSALPLPAIFSAGEVITAVEMFSLMPAIGGRRMNTAGK